MAQSARSGRPNDEFPLVKAYHRLLAWDIERAPAVTRVTERLLNPVLGKSLVVYARKPPTAPVGATAGHEAEHRGEPEVAGVG